MFPSLTYKHFLLSIFGFNLCQRTLESSNSPFYLNKILKGVKRFDESGGGWITSCINKVMVGLWRQPYLVGFHYVDLLESSFSLSVLYVIEQLELKYFNLSDVFQSSRMVMQSNYPTLLSACRCKTRWDNSKVSHCNHLFNRGSLIFEIRLWTGWKVLTKNKVVNSSSLACQKQRVNTISSYVRDRVFLCIVWSGTLAQVGRHPRCMASAPDDS